MRSWLGAAVALFVAFPIGPQAQAQDTGTVIAAGVLRVEHPRPLPISRLDLPPEDLGFAGARLAVADNNTTGQFMGQSFTLEEAVVAPDEALAALERCWRRHPLRRDAGRRRDDARAFRRRRRRGAGLQRARPRRPAARRRLPGERAASVPSRAMLTDALAQFLMLKRWERLVPDRGLARGRPALGDLPPRGGQVRGAHRRGARLRGHRRRQAHRCRPCPGPGADAGLHAARAASITW
jgi:hypothetical protein